MTNMGRLNSIADILVKREKIEGDEFECSCAAKILPEKGRGGASRKTRTAENSRRRGIKLLLMRKNRKSLRAILGWPSAVKKRRERLFWTHCRGGRAPFLCAVRTVGKRD